MTDAKQDFLDVICVGFGRTGTTTLASALNTLGYKTYHGNEMFANPECMHHKQIWIDFRNKTNNNEIISKEDWKKIYKNYNATSDWPSASFYKELIKLNPNCKVILTIRDKNKWFKSFYSTLYQIYTISNNIKSISYYFNPNVREIRNLMNTYVNGNVNNGCLPDLGSISNSKTEYFKKSLTESLQSHTKNVINFMEKEMKKKENLLLFDVSKDNWIKLCNFLDKPLPQKSLDNLDDHLPTQNSSKEWEKIIEQYRTQEQSNFDSKFILIVVSIAIIIIAYCCYYYVV